MLSLWKGLNLLAPAVTRVCGNAGRLFQQALEYLVAVAIALDVSVFGCKAEMGLAHADEHH